LAVQRGSVWVRNIAQKAKVEKRCHLSSCSQGGKKDDKREEKRVTKKKPTKGKNKCHSNWLWTVKRKIQYDSQGTVIGPSGGGTLSIESG